MIHVIKTSVSESNYEQTISLDGVDYIIRLLWNERDGHWYMTLKDASGSDIITGIKVVTNWQFAYNETDERMPNGQLWIVDTSNTEADPGLRDLGSRVKLVYIEESSLV